ncbi:hypothetical protein [Halorubrum vacuolatum]|uniref:DUF8048 domain-containing protein n=1 Tax=Halorubrum vacuolatum TaxID=63740 RepID=A0A238V9R9_HALVU|nr:hypothetical protein [Halorubrum vacuolatum]SNR30958.1 hypothetical protein SAMN06264855_102125 [Halorubrum vacuolatum]
MPAEDGSPTDGDRTDGESEDAGDHPIAGTALLKAGALASVPLARLPSLLAEVQADLAPRLDSYRRRYECIDADDEREAFLVEPDHWDVVGDRLGFSERERSAVKRSHEATVERIGSTTDRREEYDIALEIRTGVVIGVPTGTDRGRDPEDDTEHDTH